jgi:DUF971 family protein
VIRQQIPQRIHRGEREVVITWADDHVGIFPARELRLACQCAACRDEMTGRPLLDPASIPEEIHAVAIDLVGSYAIRIQWSDGHGSGIYPYDYLAERCPCDRCRAARGER